MNAVEMGKFLTSVAFVDHRRVTKEMVAAWLNILEPDTTLDEAHEAHREFRREQPGTYLEPGHIYQGVKKRRRSLVWDEKNQRPFPPLGKVYAVDVIEGDDELE